MQYYTKYSEKKKAWIVYKKPPFGAIASEVRDYASYKKKETNLQEERDKLNKQLQKLINKNMENKN